MATNRSPDLPPIDLDEAEQLLTAREAAQEAARAAKLAKEAEADREMLTLEAARTQRALRTTVNNSGLDLPTRMERLRAARAAFAGRATSDAESGASSAPAEAAPLSFEDSLEELLSQPRLTGGQRKAIRQIAVGDVPVAPTGEPVALANERSRADRLAEEVRTAQVRIATATEEVATAEIEIDDMREQIKEAEAKVEELERQLAALSTPTPAAKPTTATGTPPAEAPAASSSESLAKEIGLEATPAAPKPAPPKRRRGSKQVVQQVRDALNGGEQA